MSGDFDSCTVVNQGCRAPAGFDYYQPVGTCGHCGEPVCTSCSSRRVHLGKRQRICDNCQTQLDGHDDYVRLRAYRRAGYPEMTLFAIRECRIAYERHQREGQAIPVDRIKKHDRPAGFVILCLDERKPALATHRLFLDEESAVTYADGVSRSRFPVVFQLRR